MSVPRQMKRWLSRAMKLLFILGGGGLLSLLLVGCASQPVRLIALPEVPQFDGTRQLGGSISEVAPPAIFIDLAELIDGPDLAAQPQVAIASPQPNEFINSTDLEVEIDLKGLSIYKDESTGLGPHLQMILDNQPARSLYDLTEPIDLTDLAPGSHSLRVLAVKPWGESFKNEAAYAQTTFHVFANTGENAPDPQQPLLTYSSPQGTYGAEPILLDFYLENAPLHLIAQEALEDSIPDWRIRCDVNGQRFFFDQWRPVYLKGFEPGQNWVQLTLVDAQDNPIDNAFNSTARLINYDPEQLDSLAKLVRSELSLSAAGKIVDPNYEPPVEQPDPLMSEETAPEEVTAEETAEPAVQTPEAVEVFEAPPAEIVPTEDQPTDTVDTLPFEAKEGPLTEPSEEKSPSELSVDLSEDTEETVTADRLVEEDIDISNPAAYGEERLEDRGSVEADMPAPDLEVTEILEKTEAPSGADEDSITDSTP